MSRFWQVIISSATSGFLARLVGVGVSLVTLPIVLVHLGKVQYGIWVLVGQSIQFMSLTDLGVTNAVGRFVARFRVRGDNESLGQLMWTVGFFLCSIGLLISLIALFVSPLIPGLLHIQDPYRQDAAAVFLISAVSLAMLFPLRIGRGILAGYQKYAVPNIAQIFGSLLNLIGILSLVWLNKFSLVALALVSACSAIAIQTINVIAVWRTIRPISIFSKRFSGSILKDILSLGTSTLLMTSSAKLYRQGITIGVGLFIGTAAAGVYGVALTLMTHISYLLTQISRPMTTLASEIDARDYKTNLRTLNNTIMGASFGLGLGAAAGLYLYGEAFLKVFLRNSDWTAADYGNARIALTIMGVGLSIGIPQMVARSTLQGIGKHWQVAGRFFLACIVSVFVGFALMSSSLGIVGASIGWSTIFVLQGVWLYPALICRVVNQRIVDMLIRAYFPGACIGGLIFLGAWTSIKLFPPDSIASLALGFAVSIILGLGGIFVINRRTGLFRNIR